MKQFPALNKQITKIIQNSTGLSEASNSVSCFRQHPTHHLLSTLGFVRVSKPAHPQLRLWKAWIAWIKSPKRCRKTAHTEQTHQVGLGLNFFKSIMRSGWHRPCPAPNYSWHYSLRSWKDIHPSWPQTQPLKHPTQWHFKNITKMTTHSKWFCGKTLARFVSFNAPHGHSRPNFQIGLWIISKSSPQLQGWGAPKKIYEKITTINVRRRLHQH